MKKLAFVCVIVMLLLFGTAEANADIGVVEEPEYTVAIDIYGADYYYDWNSMDAGIPDGTLSGGQKFYVWADFGSGRLKGTTNPKASSDDFDDFPYIYSSDTLRESERISADVGERTEDTVFAATTDKLNLRTGPGTGFKVLKVLNNGTNVEYDYTFKTDTVWMYVRADGLEGWVSGDYLKTKKVGLNNQEDTTDTDSSMDTQVEDDAEDSGTALKVDTPEEDTGAEKKQLVAGIILVCLGSAILLAVLAVYLLNMRKTRNE